MNDPITLNGITLNASPVRRQEQILTPQAMDFLAKLHAEFEPRRHQLLAARETRRRAIAAGEDPRFLEETPVGDFSRPPGGSENVSDAVVFDDDRHWDEVTALRLFTSPYGCADEADAENAGFVFGKPGDIHAPVEGVHAEGDGSEGEDSTGMDESDAYDTEPAPREKGMDTHSPEDAGR